MTLCSYGTKLTREELARVATPAGTATHKPIPHISVVEKLIEKLPTQVLANLLWAAFGINRPDGGRTAPSAMNWQEIDIYVAMGDGLFLYNAKANRLEPILPQDVRAATGTQAFVATAPVDLIYVADLSKTGQSGSEAEFFTAADVGFIVSLVRMSISSVPPRDWQRSSEDLWIGPRWPRS